MQSLERGEKNTDELLNETGVEIEYLREQLDELMINGCIFQLSNGKYNVL